MPRALIIALVAGVVWWIFLRDDASAAGVAPEGSGEAPPLGGAFGGSSPELYTPPPPADPKVTLYNLDVPASATKPALLATTPPPADQTPTEAVFSATVLDRPKHDLISPDIASVLPEYRPTSKSTEPPAISPLAATNTEQKVLQSPPPAGAAPPAGTTPTQRTYVSTVADRPKLTFGPEVVSPRSEYIPPPAPTPAPPADPKPADPPPPPPPPPTKLQAALGTVVPTISTPAPTPTATTKATSTASTLSKLGLSQATLLSEPRRSASTTQPEPTTTTTTQKRGRAGGGGYV